MSQQDQSKFDYLPTDHLPTMPNLVQLDNNDILQTTKKETYSLNELIKENQQNSHI